MIDYESEITINRPVDQVYRLASDVTRLDDWTDMTNTHLISGQNGQVGSRLETTIKMGPMKQVLVFQMTELDENRRLGFKTVSKGAVEWDASYVFDGKGPSSTRMVSTGQLRFNGILKLLEPLMAGEVRSGEAKELVKFKELVEGGKYLQLKGPSAAERPQGKESCPMTSGSQMGYLIPADPLGAGISRREGRYQREWRGEW